MGIVTEPKQIDFTTGKFEANGRQYYITQKFTIERFAMYQKFETELGYGKSFSDHFNDIEAALECLNTQRLVDAIVVLTDSQRGMAVIEQKEPFVLKICALAMNVVGEDVRGITDDQITQKIDDWKEEGIDMACFFRFALNTLHGFSENYKKVTQSISELGRINQGSSL